MVKELLGYSLVSQLWRNHELTMADMFLPLILKLIHKNFKYNMHKSSIPQLHQLFRDEYNINIPILNMIDMLHRDESGSLKISNDYYVLDSDRCREMYPNLFSDKREKAIEKAYSSIQKYANDKYELEYSITEVESSLAELLLNFPKTIFREMSFDLDFPDYSEKEMHRITAEYIANCDPDEIEVFKDIFLGCILSHVIGLKESKGVDLIENDTQVFHDCAIYIDTPILIPLLKASDESTTNMYNELIQILQRSGASIKTLSHIVSEVESVLTTALNIVKNRYDFNGKKNPATLYFMRNREKVTHLELLVNNLTSYIVNVLHYEIVDPQLDANSQYMIDSGKLEDLIKNVYSDKEHADYFEVLRYSTPINTDVTSITAIQCFREGVTPRKLIDSKHLLLTKNWGLFKAANAYKDDLDGNVSLSYIIMIDTYISTIIWNVQQKPLIEEFYKHKLLADCLNVISPTEEFMNNFIKAVNEYSTKTYLTDEETKSMMLNPEYVRTAYMKCGKDSTCIFENLEEIQEKVKALYTQPYVVKLDEVTVELEKTKKEKVLLEGDVELKDKTLELTQKEIQERDDRIVVLENEKREREKEAALEQFKKQNWFRILKRYIPQKAFIIEFVVGLILIVVAFFTSWLVLSINILYLIFRTFFHLNKRYKAKTYDAVARKMFDQIYKDPLQPNSEAK